MESFESNLNSIPISPSISYVNFFNFKNYSSINELDFIILKRDESSIDKPSESFKLQFNNELFGYYVGQNSSITNKLSLSNNYSDYYFNKDETLNHNSFKSSAVISSDLHFKNIGIMTPRVKLIYPVQLENDNKTINEDSESITFNYHNQFSENRFFGNDLFDSSPRIIFGIENNYNIENKELSLKINQSYDVNMINNYAYKINQNSKFSDYSIESKLRVDEFSLIIDTRLDEENLSKKEMNYEINFEKILNTSLIYNETQSEAYRNLSNDTQSVVIKVSKKINNNVKINFESNLDVKNNYDPYKGIFNFAALLDIILLYL